MFTKVVITHSKAVLDRIGTTAIDSLDIEKAILIPYLLLQGNPNHEHFLHFYHDQEAWNRLQKLIPETKRIGVHISLETAQSVHPCTLLVAVTLWKAGKSKNPLRERWFWVKNQKIILYDE